MTKSMTEEERWRRLRELNDAMAAKRRLEPPPESEADQWVLVFMDEDDASGHTVKRGIQTWWPSAEADEWHRLRFDFDEHTD